MKTPKKSHDTIRQNGNVVKKPQKHDANLQKNTTLYFQVGLIVCLLAAYGLFEMKFETKAEPIADFYIPKDEDLYVFDEQFTTYEEEVKRKEVKKRTLTYKAPVIKEDDPIFDTPEFINEAPVSDATPLTPDAVPDIKIEEEVPIPILIIEQVPVYPGCENEKTNDDKRKCMSDKITKLVQKQFNTDLANDLGLTGRQTILTQFKIDNIGHVTEIQSRAPHPKLQEEAERVINKIPEMKPGLQRNKPVGVIYSLPIIFEVN
ncbi:energy transducer TonB [Flavobacteriaceae bacterium XHP0103]|uniref:energy transducer TonB n=1 Tax=Marixanthotalea marina TaxID=2844359 RepID=UPI002989A32C|nr:energy transducer TonB [Marixanthotalea marina]MBU3820925.1 energy transducer TonB [Marixanthotalea marina]